MSDLKLSEKEKIKEIVFLSEKKDGKIISLPYEIVVNENGTIEYQRVFPFLLNGKKS